MMDRRRFLLSSLAGVFAAPLAGEGQQIARAVKIGVLCAGHGPFPLQLGSTQSLTLALENVGLFSGRTLTWDIGGTTESADHLAAKAQDLVSRRPDLILV